MMKKWLGMLLLAALLVSLAGCGKGTGTENAGTAVAEEPAGGTETAQDEAEQPQDEAEQPQEERAVEETAAPETAVTTARIGDADLAFSNETEYYDLSYRHPDAFELEINEETGHPRHILCYKVEGYEPQAVKIVITRAEGFTPEERLADVYFSDVTTEEIGGIHWAAGRKDMEDEQILIWSCAKDDWAYTFSFLTDYPESFDQTEFARAFVGEVTIR